MCCGRGCCDDLFQIAHWRGRSFCVSLINPNIHTRAHPLTARKSNLFILWHLLPSIGYLCCYDLFFQARRMIDYVCIYHQLETNYKTKIAFLIHREKIGMRTGVFGPSCERQSRRELEMLSFKSAEWKTYTIMSAVSALHATLNLFGPETSSDCSTSMIKHYE